MESWIGAEPHLRVVGTLNGEELDLDLKGKDAANTAKLFCLREYTVPANEAKEPDYAKGKNSEVQISGAVEVGGEARTLVIELKRHDFQKHADGTQVTIIPRDDEKDPGPSQMWLELEWYKGKSEEAVYEQAAAGGKLSLERYDGKPGADGLVIPDNEGLVAGFATAKWSATDELSISFSAKCTKSDVEIEGAE